MHIIHISFIPQFRGGERQLLLLHQGLIDASLLSFIICPRTSGLVHTKSTNIIPVPWGKIHSVYGIFTLLRWVRHKAPFIIHCHDSFALNIGLLIKIIFGYPCVYSRKALYPIRDNIFNRWKLSLCAQVIAVSKAVAMECGKACRKEAITVIHDGVPFESPGHLSGTEARKRLNIPDAAFVIGSVGFFTSEKNFGAILECAGILKPRRDVIFVCIGYITHKDLQKARVHSNLRCTGIVPDAINYYKAFDLYISTAIKEGLGSALLDAVVRDIPVVAMDAGGTRDIFASSPHFLVPQSDTAALIAKINAIIDNYDLAKREATLFGDAARHIFSVAAMVEKHIDLYKRITDHERNAYGNQR